MNFTMSHPPKTDAEGYNCVLQHTTKTALAHHLGVSKQLISRWKFIPTQYLLRVTEMTHLPFSWIRPELDANLSTLFGRPIEPFLPELIRIFTPTQKVHHQNGQAEESIPEIPKAAKRKRGRPRKKAV